MGYPSMNSDLYYRLKASEMGLPNKTDENMVKQLQSEILRLQDIVIHQMEIRQGDLMKLNEIEKEYLKLDKRMAICEQQIESKQYQYLKRYK